MPTPSGESTVTGRKVNRNLGLSVFNPDTSSGDEEAPPRATGSSISKPLPPVNQGYYSPQVQNQTLGQPQYNPRTVMRHPSGPIHSASSSASSISISTSSSNTPHGRTHQAQSSPTSRSPLYVGGSSSSSRSSPANDTTPPPSTPSSNLAPGSFAGGVTDDRNMDGLGLLDDNDYPVHPRSGLSPYADQTHSASSPQLNTKPNPPPMNRVESSERLIITASADAENHSIVDITGATDASYIRELIFSKLHIPDDEHNDYSIYRTELGEAALGDAVSDDQLMTYCVAWADNKGTLKFLVQRNIAQPPPHHQRPHLPPLAATPQFYSSSQFRREENRSSAERELDRPPWDRQSNNGGYDGYDGDVDGRRPRRRLQSPPPIDTNPNPAPSNSSSNFSRRHREPSASSAESYGFSPTSPGGSQNHAPSVSISPLARRVPAPTMASTMGPPTSSTGGSPYLQPQYSLPSHRRRESETAAQEREAALEASERMKLNQAKEYDGIYKRQQMEKERDRRRQLDATIPQPMLRSHRTESMDSSNSVPHGWVLVNEKEKTPSFSGGSAIRGNPSFTRSNTASATVGVTNADWIGSPPSDGPRWSPNSGPAPGNAARSNTSGGTPTTPLQRAHPPLPSGASGKYPNPHPHPRTGQGSHAPLPPGASDPMRARREREQQEQQQRQGSSGSSAFYPIPVAGVSNGPAAGMLRPSRADSSSNTMNNGLRSPRSLSDLRTNFGPTSPGLRTGPAPVPSQPTLPISGRKPSALPTTTPTLLNENIYNFSRQPTSPNRLQISSPSRPILQPSTLYSGPPSTTRSPGSSMDNYAPRSLGSSGSTLFSGGVFADSAFNSGSRLRSKQSQDKLSSAATLDRTTAPYAQQPSQALQNNQSRDPNGNINASTTYRYGWLSNTSSPNNSRPHSGDNGDDLGAPNALDAQRPSPIESSQADALSRLESGRPSVSLTVPNSVHVDQSNISPLSDVPGSGHMQIPQAVLTPSSPIGNPAADTVHLRDEDHPFSSSRSDIPMAVSPAISATSSQELTDDGSEGTLKPGDRTWMMSLMSGSDNDADGEGYSRRSRHGAASAATSPGGAVISTARKVTVKRRASALKAQAAAAPAGFGPHPQNYQPEEEEFGEEEEYTDEEEEEDERFWNTPSTLSTAPPSAKTTPRLEEPDGTATLMPSSSSLQQRGRGPSLSLQMPSILVDDRASPTASTSELTPHNEGNNLTPTGGADLGRRESFRRDTWAVRPSAEDVFERLQEFFPDHDIDKPVFDPLQVKGGVPSSLPSPTTEVIQPIPAAVSQLKDNKYRHRKSIRFVAEEGKKALEKARSAKEPTARAAALARKRSTKLWGRKVEEVTPGQMQQDIPPIPESPTAPGPVRPTIKWVKGELIGKGTFGKVFLALNVTTSEFIAVKQVEVPQTPSDQDDIRQVSIVNALKAEQQTLEMLDHPNIVQYLGFEETREFFSVFLEYVPGGSIGSCIRKHGKFEEQVSKSFTGQILDGLAYLHSNKIIHRDVKADNVLVDLYGICKLSDFGISKRSDEIYNNAAMTAMQGTLFWMAPEMLHNNKKGYNAKIDIWSLGCVFIEMFAGRRPWEQDDFVSVMFKVGHNKMAPPIPEDVVLSEGANDFRLQCFIQDPDQRPTAEALKAHPWLIMKRGWHFTGF